MNKAKSRMEKPAANQANRRQEVSDQICLKSALPYVMAHKDKPLLFVLPIDLIRSDSKVNTDFWEDLMICHSLGIRCVICLEATRMSSLRRGEKNQAVTEAQLNTIKRQLAEKTGQCLGYLTRAAHAIRGHVPVLAGNWLLAQPVGVVDGKDYQRRGRLRKLHTGSVTEALEAGNIVLLSNLATDKGGQEYVVPTMDIANTLCNGADINKIIFYTGSLPVNYRSLAMDVRDINSLNQKAPPEITSFVRDAEYYCRYCGVSRVHLISVEVEHALLGELFTSNGRGMMLHSDIYERLEAPAASDMRTIKKMIEPMEEAGVLRPRPVRVLEEARERFRVIKQDGVIVGCAALSPLKNNPGYAELECVVVRKEFSDRGYGGRLLRSMERLATETNYSHLVVMSTQSITWFRERGYKPTKQQVEMHPDCKQRKAKVLIKELPE